MTDFGGGESASVGDEGPRRADGPYGDLPEHLPPVQPPSAGFIVQLFLIPALIVAVVVGVWALFGRMAAGEQDWHVLAEELRSNNPHRHWRAALGLAQLLEADRQRGAEGKGLAHNADLARVLSDQLREELAIGTPSDDEVKQAAYLARTLGLLDVPATVIPTLETAIASGHDREIRKNALGSIALIAGRAAEGQGDAAAALRDPVLTDDLIAVSRESGEEQDRVMRQLAAYTLGLVPTEAARARLDVMLADADRSTRVNAAVGLARQDSTAGLPVFRDVLAHAVTAEAPAAAQPPEKKTSAGTLWMAGLIVVIVAGLLLMAAAPQRAGKIAAATFCLAGLLFIGQRIAQRPLDRPKQAAGAVQQARPLTPEERRRAEDERFADLVAVKNSLKAVADLSDQWTPDQRKDLTTLIQPIAEDHRVPDIRTEAQRVVQTLAAAG